jgi:hypothetical protein
MGRDAAKIKREERAVAEFTCPECARRPGHPCWSLKSVKDSTMIPHPERVALVRDERFDLAMQIRCPVEVCRAMPGRPCWKFYKREARRRDLPRPHVERVRLAGELKAAGTLEAHKDEMAKLNPEVRLGRRLGTTWRRGIDR